LESISRAPSVSSVVESTAPEYASWVEASDPNESGVTGRTCSDAPGRTASLACAVQVTSWVSDPRGANSSSDQFTTVLPRPSPTTTPPGASTSRNTPGRVVDNVPTSGTAT